MSNVSYPRKLRYMREDIDRKVNHENSINKKINDKNAKVESDDRKYSSLVSLLKKELVKRKIEISDKEFDQKLDEIITYCFSKFPNIRKRYVGSTIPDIRNAVKRAINNEKKFESGVREKE